MNEFADRLQRGKNRMRELCIQTALLNTPTSVRFVIVRRNLSGCANAEVISAPRPVTRRALAIFLHECAHIALCHVGNNGNHKPQHVKEYEAERWAFDRMREAGIRVPRKSLRRAKGYVAYKIRQARKRGAKRVDPNALRWAGG